MIEEQIKTVEFYQTIEIMPYSDETEDEAKERNNRDLSYAIKQLQTLKDISHALEHQNALELSDFKMEDVKNMELWKIK